MPKLTVSELAALTRALGLNLTESEMHDRLTRYNGTADFLTEAARSGNLRSVMPLMEPSQPAPGKELNA